jgi:hyperosmotically inducible periplasmic protein
MEVRRLRAPLVVMAAIALAACSKQVGNNAESKTSVGTKIDHAQDKLQRAGERAREEIQEATEKTQQAISKAGDKLSAGSRGTNTDIPYSAPPTPASSLATPATTGATPAAGTTPTPGAAAPAAAATTNAATAAPAQAGAETPMSTTTTLSSGPSTSVKVTGVSKETRATINDAAITTSIRADFLKDPDLSVLKIDVNTTDGVVTLNGLADNESAKARAARMAQSVKGVREVRNFLTVKRVG